MNQYTATMKCVVECHFTVSAPNAEEAAEIARRNFSFDRSTVDVLDVELYDVTEA